MPIANFGDRPRVESGTILMWAGTLSEIPDGWVLCDGNNGTPDLTDRFIKGVPSAGTAPGGTGGQGEWTMNTSKMPSHTHSGEASEAGDHSHTIWYLNQNDRDEIVSNQGAGSGYNVNTSNDGAHSHSITVDPTGNDQPVNNLPAYYELAFIQKT